jgi:hypothetical protein
VPDHPTPRSHTREAIRATDEAGRGPVLAWNSITGHVTVTVHPEVPGFPAPDTVLEELGTVRTGGHDDPEYGPWDPDFYQAAARLAAEAGWRRHKVNRHGSFAPHRGWRITTHNDGTHLATIDRAASAEAMARHADTLARLGMAVDVPGPAAETIRRLRVHRDSLAEQDDLIAAGIDAGMSDRAIAREMGLAPATIGRKRKALPAGAGYFEDKARAVFERAGGEPGRAGSLAAWARTVHPTRDHRLGVIVAEDGAILAQTRRSKPGPDGVSAAYVTDVYDDADRATLGSEAGLALGQFRRRAGMQVIQVTYSDVCTGAGRAAQ